MTFAEYVLSLPITPGPRGDFIRDMQLVIQADELPLVECWAEILEFMQECGACKEAIDAACEVWCELTDIEMNGPIITSEGFLYHRVAKDLDTYLEHGGPDGEAADIRFARFHGLTDRIALIRECWADARRQKTGVQRRVYRRF